MNRYNLDFRRRWRFVPVEIDGSPWLGEYCQSCGEAYSQCWSADDALWKDVTGRDDGSGLLCMQCFDALAQGKGINVVWTAIRGK